MNRFVAAALCAALAAAGAARAGEKVEEGKPAPAVVLPAVQADRALPDKKDATTLDLKDLRGKTVVLFFFPKAMTRG